MEINMQVNNETEHVQEEQPKEKPLTREQRRKKEEIEREAEETFNRLSNRFLDFFIDAEDPEGNEVAEKLSTISAQWKSYCNKRQLVPQAKGMMDAYAASVLKDYQENKHPKTNGDLLPQEPVQNS
jgi:hypothetical protein